MFKAPPTLTPTQVRVFESYAKWYRDFKPDGKLLEAEKQQRLLKFQAITVAFNNELRQDIGLEPKEEGNAVSSAEDS